MTTLRRCTVAGFALTSLVFALASAHCGGTTFVSNAKPDGSTPPPGPPPPGPSPPNLPAPVNHRPAATACPTDRPPGINSDAGVPDSGFPGECTRDSDCTQGKNGRCLPPEHNRAGDSCSYDECASDSDCPSGKLCDCGAPISLYGRLGNVCMPGNCRVDGDCGTGGYCSPTWDTTCGSYSGVVGYYCHTASDDCTNDNECSEGGFGYCAWQPTAGKWACSYGICAG